MRLLSSLRGWPKRHEATTDDSQRSASSWRLRLLPTLRGSKQNKPHRTKFDLELQQPDTNDDQTDSGVLDMFQTLMSNSGQVPLPPKPLTLSENNDADDAVTSGSNREGLHYWHTEDPNFLPTAYPLTRTDPRSMPPAKWGALNLAASAALLERPLKRFKSVADRHPRFRFGPRQPGGDTSDPDKRSLSEDGMSVTGGTRSAVETASPKYTYISQDGKLVEREVHRWPELKQPKLTLRYKLMEPYASNYGKRAKLRTSASMQKFTLPRTRWIYQRPIFLIPRSIVEENKRRLIARHMLKDRFDQTCDPILPSAVSLQEKEQCKRYLENQATKYAKDTEERIAHEDKMKLKAQAPLSGQRS